MASVKIVDLPLQSYNRKLGHKIGRFAIKSEALAALLLAAASWVELHPKILAAVSCTLRPWLHPVGVSFSWRGQLSRAGNKHSGGQCVKVIFNFLLQHMYSDRRGYGQKPPRTKPSRQKTLGQKPRTKALANN